MSTLTSSKIQLWSPGIMLSLISLETAQKLVANHQAIIINSQAIYRTPEGCDECFLLRNSSIICKKVATNSTKHLADKCDKRISIKEQRGK